ncbi:exported hypothetical protein [Candidatus Sulfopaludibacter sp. SbA6]|nr:exported hypothetical protein [Candidatus Sulfopaludibacter sp. SbA6]
MRAAFWPAALLMVAALSALLLFWVGRERGKLRPSTRAFLRQTGFGLNAMPGYVYVRWIRPYNALLRLPDPRTSRTSARAAGVAGQALSRQGAHARARAGNSHAEPRISATRIWSRSRPSRRRAISW